MSAKQAAIAAGSIFLLALLPLPSALAQAGHRAGGNVNHAGQSSNQFPPQKAQAGANTTDGTTTGSSGPQKKGGSKGPPKPQASMCDSYKGAVHQDCLDTILRSVGQQNSGGSAPQKKGG